MSESHHAIVWINHSEATVSRFRDGTMPDNIEFYERIAVALDNDSEVVFTGSGNAKTELKAFLDQHHPTVSSRLEKGAARCAAGGPS
jgi:hypothetical protein